MGSRGKSPVREPTGGNPLKSDPELIELVDKAENIKTYKRFQGWKDTFLKKFESFLAKPGIDKAEKASDEFKQLMNTITKHLDSCNDMIDKGILTNEKVTVKGRNSLNELCKNVKICCKATEELIPHRKMDEKKRGYSKFQLGAVLVRDGFSCFDQMKNLSESLKVMGEEKLSEVADQQQLRLFEDYQKEFKKFCDVMADLGLFEVMLACRKFAEPPDYEEPDYIEITVEASNGKKIHLEIDSADTVGQVKEAIAKQCEIEPSKQVLKFKGKALTDDNMTLDAAGVRDGSVLTVSPPMIPITINTMDGKKIKIDVDPMKPMSDVKQKLKEKTGLSTDNQNFLMNGKPFPFDDNKLPAECGIKDGSELDLEPKTMKVSVALPDGKKISVIVKPSDTPEDVKKKIEAETGLSVPKQILQHKDKECPEGGTIKDLGIKDGDDLKVEIAKIPVTVNTPDGKKIKVMIDPTETLAVIRKQLEKETGVPVKKQTLFLKDKELGVGDDDKTAEECGIVDGSVIDMPNMMIFIDMETGVIGKIQRDKLGKEVMQKLTFSSGKDLDSLKQQIKDIN